MSTERTQIAGSGQASLAVLGAADRGRDRRPLLELGVRQPVEEVDAAKLVDKRERRAELAACHALADEVAR